MTRRSADSCCRIRGMTLYTAEKMDEPQTFSKQMQEKLDESIASTCFTTISRLHYFMHKITLQACCTGCPPTVSSRKANSCGRVGRGWTREICDRINGTITRGQKESLAKDDVS